MGPRFRGDERASGATLRRTHDLTPTLAAPLTERRTAGDLLPACILLVMILSIVAIMAHLRVVLWLAWTSRPPRDTDLTYTASNFVEVFSDARTYSVLVDTFAFAFV